MCTSAPGLDWPCHIGAGTGRATSAPGLDWPCHICAGTGLAVPASAPGLAQRWFGQHLKRNSPQRSMLHCSATQCGQVPHGTGVQAGARWSLRCQGTRGAVEYHEALNPRESAQPQLVSHSCGSVLADGSTATAHSPWASATTYGGPCCTYKLASGRGCEASRSFLRACSMAICLPQAKRRCRSPQGRETATGRVPWGASGPPG
jgi:hypothetical protein